MDKYLRFLLIAGFVLLGFSATAQVGNTIDQRLIDMYGQSRISQMQATQPELLEYLNYYIRHAYEIIYDVPQDKLFQFEDISTITNTRTGQPLTEADLKNLNVMDLSIRRKPDQHLTFKVGNTGTVVVFVAPDVVKLQYDVEKLKTN